MGKLVCIELENFKSYKCQQTIGPFHPFTSVIGPNGSGKSNLMDAISFVLGVHSSHLRSQNLKDMIHRSDSPEGARVTAVYETTPGNQVRFTRSINQDGHSEYRINNTIVPYIQYNAAWEDNNILVKAKNFLVFQGDVESVASQNPKDLTCLIERISGSFEYRDRYDDLKQKMEEAMETSAHCFNRKRSVAFEIKQYEEQKAEAEKFEQLVVDKQNLVIQYLLWKLFHIEEKSNALRDQINEKDASKGSLKSEVEALEEAFRKAREQKALIHREKVKCELHIRKIDRQLDEQLPTSISHKEKISQLEKRIKQTEQNIARIKRDGQQQELVVQTLENDAHLLKERIDEYEDSVPLLRNGPTLTSNQLLDYERRKQQVSIQAVEEQHVLQQYQRQFRTEKQHIDENKAKIDRLAQEETEAKAKLYQMNEEKTAISLEAEQLTEQLSTRQNELRQLENERKTTHQREVELNEKLQDTLNKLMEASVNEYESAQDTKFSECITAMKSIYPSVYGRLIDFCRPTQRKYDTAVATVLGKNMSAIVVEDEQTAFDCIQYMREQHVGTTTFLPINSLSIPPIHDRYHELTSGCRLAYDVLKFDKKYASVVQYACGSTLLVDTLDIAKQICFNMDENVKAVTLDGNVIHRSGLMTGGSRSTHTTTTWVHSDIEELTRARDTYLHELHTISKTKRMGSAEDAARSDCSNLSSQLSTLNEEWITRGRTCEGLERTLQDIRQKINQAIQPHEQSKLALDQLEARINQVQAKIDQVEDHVYEDFCAEINVSNIREYEMSQYGVSEEVAERRAQFAAQKSRLDTQIAFEREQLNELVVRLQKLETTIIQDTAARSELENQLNGMSGVSETLQSQLQTYTIDLERQIQLEASQQVEINEIGRALEYKGRNVDEIVRENRVIESEINQVRAERVAIFRKCKLEGIQLPLTHGSMDDIIIEEDGVNMDTSMTDTMDMSMDISQTSIQSTDWEVQVDFSQVGQGQRTDDSLALDRMFTEKIRQFAEDIERMAPNLKAIDRLEGVTERLKVAEQEFNSARQATKAAKEQFQTIKQKRYSLFNEAFNHISEKIDTIYKDLTKSNVFPLGGTAYLSMEDTDEPYLGGITYHAMPPMKRFRDMESLSGGEKSVAALALLFAIHGYKPSPFFVLDEVDAALDNTNISTVARYIRETASRDTQFIVISLKHTFYERAQSLVGIYRDRELNSSKTMTLMLDQFDQN